MIGSVAGGTLADYFGRKKVLIITGVIAMVGVVLCCLCFTLYWLIICRAILGLSVGLSGVICPLYVGEMAPESIKGTLGTLFQLSITIGILVAYVVGYFLIQINQFQWSWRLQYAIGFIPGFALAILAFVFVDESDKWISQKKKDSHVTDPMLKDNQESSSGWRLLFSSYNFLVLIIGVELALALQFTGINAVMYYAPKILIGAGFGKSADPMMPYLLTIFVGAWNFISTVVSVFLSDRFPRKRLMLAGMAIIFIGDLILGIAYIFISKAENDSSSGWAYVSLVSLALFIAGFEIGPGALFWVFLSEIYTPDIKDQANGFVNLLQWTFNLILSIVFPIIVSKPSAAPYPFFFFAVVALFSVVFLAIFLPSKQSLDNSEEDIN
eukprot:TRINITY_DN1137_c0_g1_i5.p1 TRINITY_DN1137_c0_g1~~TRINITY_DN1137_c0_g1_i5.p1  ORF type:complete len:382 (-),score=61.72 TRINITY_DN1137_c0_g1_i5:43-1188(-)